MKSFNDWDKVDFEAMEADVDNAEFTFASERLKNRIKFRKCLGEVLMKLGRYLKTQKILEVRSRKNGAKFEGSKIPVPELIVILKEIENKLNIKPDGDEELLQLLQKVDVFPKLTEFEKDLDNLVLSLRQQTYIQLSEDYFKNGLLIKSFSFARLLLISDRNLAFGWILTSRILFALGLRLICELHLEQLNMMNETNKLPIDIYDEYLKLSEKVSNLDFKTPEFKKDMALKVADLLSVEGFYKAANEIYMQVSPEDEDFALARMSSMYSELQSFEFESFESKVFFFEPFFFYLLASWDLKNLRLSLAQEMNAQAVRMGDPCPVLPKVLQEEAAKKNVTNKELFDALLAELQREIEFEKHQTGSVEF